MSKHLDKLLLGGAVLACAAAGAFYALNHKNKAVVKPANAGIAPKGAEYKPVELPGATRLADQWQRPRYDEDDKWGYDVFTPVESTWNAGNQEYDPKGGIQVAPPFGLRLVSVGHPVYRYTLQAHYPDPKTRQDILKISNSEKQEDEPGQTFSAKKGDKIASAKIEIRNFKIDSVTNPDGTTTPRPIVTIYDEELKREFSITEKPFEFLDITNVVLARTDDSSKSWTLHAIEEQIKEEDSDSYLGTFTLKDIDIASRVVILEKLYKPNPRKPGVKTETQTLSVEDKSAKPAPAKESAVKNP